MFRSRPPSPPKSGKRPLRKRLTSAAALACGVALCALAAGALFAPTFVFGSESGRLHPGPEVVVESTEVPVGVGAGATSAETGDSALTGDGALTAAAVGADQGTLLVTLPWGNQAGQVGLAQPQQGLTRGPEALAVAPDGRIAVLDSVNRRVVFLDSAGQVTNTATVPLSEPRFLAVTNG
jgi:hypothetical protein